MRWKTFESPTTNFTFVLETKKQQRKIYYWTNWITFILFGLMTFWLNFRLFYFSDDLGSVPLGNYTPIKIFNTNFELGVTRTHSSSPNHTSPHKYQAPPPPPPRTHSNGKGKHFFVKCENNRFWFGIILFQNDFWRN